MIEHSPRPWARILFHLLLAVFLANAANKFFVPDLKYEDAHQFYAKVFQFHGQAPDQYRILPLLGLKVLCGHLPFNHAVLVFNFLTSFVCFEIFYRLLRKARPIHRLVFNVVLAVSFIYLQYTGWRPDTMGLLLVALLTLLPGFFLPKSALQTALIFMGVIALAFSRSDIALVYAVFLAIYQPMHIALRLGLVALPILVQVSLQNWIFADATYYTKPWMLWDNLGGHYFFRNPATWLIFAVMVGFYAKIGQFVRKTWKSFRILYVLIAGYLVLVLFVGRINEYRLYLPLVPLLICAWDRTEPSDGKKTGRI